MADLRRDVNRTIHQMLENLKLFSERSPDRPIRGAHEDFNALLARAKEAFPESRTIQETTELTSRSSLLELVTKLSAIQGAVSFSPST